MSEESRARERSGGKPARGRKFWTVEHLTSAPFLLALSTALLCALGLVMVFSASSVEMVTEGLSPLYQVRSQALYLLMGVVVCVAVRAAGASAFVCSKVFYALWAVAVLLLVAVLAFGNNSHGATRWLVFGPVSVQPSEFAKLVVIMAAARILAGLELRELTLKRACVLGCVFVLAPLLLIYLQKDLGTILIVVASIFLMLILIGVPARYLVGLVAVGLVAVLLLVRAESYRSARFSIWLDPYSDYYGDGWQPIHALYAFASGGFFGLGIGNSRQKYSYLPEAQNDYIFAIIGEELGFVGAAFVIALFVLWGACAFKISYQAKERDRVTSLMVAGLASMVEIQALMNIGGTTGLLPMSGRTLPFISAGGSSMLSLMIVVGLILGAARENEAAASEARARRAARQRRPAVQLTVIEGGAARPRQRAGRPQEAVRPEGPRGVDGGRR